MRIKEIVNQLERVLKHDILSRIDLDDFAKIDPGFPLPSSIILKPNNTCLTVDQIDDLKEGKVVEVVCTIEGTYDKTQSDRNLTKVNNYFKLDISSLRIQILKNMLEIVNLEYRISG